MVGRRNDDKRELISIHNDFRAHHRNIGGGLFGSEPLHVPRFRRDSPPCGMASRTCRNVNVRFSDELPTLGIDRQVLNCQNYCTNESDEEKREVEKMVTVDIQPQLEKHFKEIVQEFYNGDESAAINEAIKIFIQRKKERNMTWRQRFDQVVSRIRNQVEASGGITEGEIEVAIRRVRRRENARHSKSCD